MTMKIRTSRKSLWRNFTSQRHLRSLKPIDSSHVTLRNQLQLSHRFMTALVTYLQIIPGIWLSVMRMSTKSVFSIKLNNLMPKPNFFSLTRKLPSAIWTLEFYSMQIAWIMEWSFSKQQLKKGTLTWTNGKNNGKNTGKKSEE